MVAFAGPVRALVLSAAVVSALASVAALGGCDDADPVAADVVPVKIAGKTFHLELAADDAKRMRGLGGRTHIEDDGGMLFAFRAPHETAFVMRDCPIDIDILYLDGAGRVLTAYTMKAEPPRGPDEGKEGDFGNAKYESRLKKYPSRYPTQFVIELKPGRIKEVGVKEGDQVGFDVAGLKRRAK